MWLMLCCCYYLFLFTDFVDVETRQTVGDFFFAWIIGLAAINLMTSIGLVIS